MLIDTAEDRQTNQYFGKYSGEVMSFDALPEENAKRGEILAQVPGILEEDAEGNSRPLVVTAKPSFLPGFFFIPEEGHKVWVEFVAGNIDFPIWTGVWYPNDQTPLAAAGATPTRFQKVIRTASGHVVQLDDTEGSEAITVIHTSGAQLTIDKDGSVLVADKESTFLFMNAKDKQTTLADSSGCMLTLRSDGAVVAAKDGTLVEVKDGTVSIVAKDAVTLTAKDVLLKSASVTLGDGASQPAVLGMDFMTIFNAHTHGSAMGPTTPPIPIPGNMFAPAPVGKGLSNSVKVGA
jgi:hypothetical protein